MDRQDAKRDKFSGLNEEEQNHGWTWMNTDSRSVFSWRSWRLGGETLCLVRGICGIFGMCAGGLRRRCMVVALTGSHRPPPTMNTLLSQIRHYVTFLTGLGAMLLAHSLITPDQVSQANAAGAQLVEPVMVILGLFAAGVSRLVMAGVAKSFEAIGSHASGIWTPVMTIGGLSMAAGLMGFSLPSCTSAPVPTRLCLVTGQGTVCYSSKSGLSAEVDATSGK